MFGALVAVADESRWKMLKRISEGAVCACKLPAHIGISQPAVSQHLKVLLEAGLIRKRKDGAKRIYSLSRRGAKVLADVSRW